MPFGGIWYSIGSGIQSKLPIMETNMVRKKPKKKKVMFYAKKGKTSPTGYDDGSRSITMAPELEEVLKEQRRLFTKKSGGEPGPDNPQFITRETTERLMNQVVEAMRKAGFDEAYIYAYRKTGLFITEENVGLMKPEELEDFEEAIREYERRKGIVD